jgi:hypothetical protein
MKSSLQIYKIGLASLGFAFTSLFVALGIEQVINPPRRAIGFAGSELLVIFGPAWLYWTGWLTWTFSHKRLLNSIYPRKAKFTTIGVYLLFVGTVLIATIVG